MPMSTPSKIFQKNVRLGIDNFQFQRPSREGGRFMHPR